MERNLRQTNSRPHFPSRVCRKKTDPVREFSSAIIARRGSRRISAVSETAMSMLLVIRLYRRCGSAASSTERIWLEALAVDVAGADS
jgi:hypothetical protein